MSSLININKNWQFLLKSVEREALAYEATEQLDLPHTWNAIDGVDGGNDYYRGLGWYVKNLEIDTNHQGNVYLDFEGVNSVCDVYLNGIHLGRHEGGYSGFRFDITNIMKETNRLEVAVDNSHVEEVYPLFADFTFYGGIYRDVNILYTPEIHFERMDLASSGVYVSQTKITHSEAIVKVKAHVNNSREAKDVTCQVHWMGADNQLVLSESKTSLVDKKGEFEIDLVIKNPKLWEAIQNPYLYNCVVSLSVYETELESITIPTGLRYFEFDEKKGFFLNGKSLKLKGVSRHQDRAVVGNALLKEHQIEDMELIKEIGANSIRLAHYQHSQFFYDLCDQNGMIVWAEIPYISKTSGTDPTAANAISQMRELIRQNYNHSSIIMWGVQNEIGIMGEDKPLAEIVRVIHDVVKEEDTTRVTTQAQVMMTDEEDPAHYVTDTVAWNKYYGWYVGETEGFVDFIESFRDKNPNKAFGISEYGAEGIIKWHSDEPKVKDYSEEYHALYHEKTLKIFNSYDFIWGTYVWNMFDFGSDMRDEGGIQGMNNKGLVTFDRRTKKDAFYWYQSMWSTNPMVHITSKRFVERHTDDIVVKVYSNLQIVTLIHNSQLVGLTKKQGSIFYFNVQLTEGDNTVVAIAGELKDHTVFKKVAQQNLNYVLPDSESKKGIVLDASDNVQNWFDLENKTEEVSLVFEYPKGRLSIKEPIRVIIEKAEGEAVLRKFIAPIFDHRMFAMIKGLSLDKIAGIQPDSLPKSLLAAINQELILLEK